MVQQNRDPWADASNQAVGALYKYYMSRPTEADLVAAQLERETKQAQLQRLNLQNQSDTRAMGMGDFTIPNLSPQIRNDLYRRSLESRGETDAARLFGSYVNKPMQLDAGDTKYIVDGSTGLPIQAYGVGTAPKVEIDSKGGRIIQTPGTPAANRPAMQPQYDPLTTAQIRQESGFNPNAVSPAGAAGIMQIMPDTARDPGFGVKPLQGWDGVDPRTALVEEQVRFGNDYRSAMTDRYGSTELGLAAYNAGPGAVDQYGGIPPYPETQQYVSNIMGEVNGAQPQPVAQPPLNQPAAQPTVGQDGTIITNLPTSPAVQAKENEKNRLKNVSSDMVNDEIRRSLNLLDESGGSVAGLVGSLTKGIPMMPAHDFQQMLNTVKANIGFDKLQSMRDASPTGGALGQVSEFENELLQAVYGSLQQSQTPEQLRYNLMRMQNTYNDIIHGNGQGPERFQIPTPKTIGEMNTPEQLQGVLEFFNYDPPADIKDMVIKRANVLGL